MSMKFAERPSMPSLRVLCRSWRAGCLAALLGMGIAGLAADGARAQDDGGQDWMRFVTGTGTEPAPDSREFGRQWEANPPRGYPTLSRDNIGPMKAAIKRYKAIVKKGGWKPIPAVKLGPGYASKAVRLLRRRLKLSGDLGSGSNTTSSFYNYYVEKAVRRYQASNGLTPTGVVDKRTRAALNVPARTRLKQLKTNLARLRRAAQSASKRYIVVNIPAAQIEAVENGRVVSRHSGVVGKVDRKTPLLSSRIHELNFNPVWRLPPTVINKDLIPKGRRMARAGKNVLVKYGIDAYGTNGRKLDPYKIRWNSGQPRRLSYRQKPGKDNPMGFVKINFHNGHSVYMHDTPSRSIFGRNFRAASSGCVRVQNIERLAAWILKHNKGWDVARVKQMRKNGKRLDLRVKKPVRLFFVYLTAWATKDGIVQFRRDLYRRDGVGLTASAY